VAELAAQVLILLGERRRRPLPLVALAAELGDAARLARRRAAAGGAAPRQRRFVLGLDPTEEAAHRGLALDDGVEERSEERELPLRQLLEPRGAAARRGVGAVRPSVLELLEGLEALGQPHFQLQRVGAQVGRRRPRRRRPLLRVHLRRRQVVARRVRRGAERRRRVRARAAHDPLSDRRRRRRATAARCRVVEAARRQRRARLRAPHRRAALGDRRLARRRVEAAPRLPQLHRARQRALAARRRLAPEAAGREHRGGRRAREAGAARPLPRPRRRRRAL